MGSALLFSDKMIPMKSILRIFSAFIVALFFVVLPIAHCPLASAQTLHQDEQAVWRAKVIEITDQKTETVPGFDITTQTQTVTAELVSGERKGELVTFRNDFTQVDEGDRFFLVYTKTVDGFERYAVQEVDRTIPLAVLVLVFVGAVLLLSGWQGVRSIVSLIVSIGVVIFVLLPLLLAGYPPVLTTTLIAGGILVIAIVATHGWNMRSAVALAGTWIAVAFTGILSTIFVSLTTLTGFSSDESVFLNVSTNGTLDFTGLLLAAIIIGVIGVLDDIAITQVAVVRELWEHDNAMDPRELYRKALRVGKEHVGALVNTLVFAYTGAALPLLLLFSNTTASGITLINQEVLTTEIVRTLVGSIGLILTVPITTALAVWLRGRLGGGGGGGHSHGHHHGHTH